VTVTLQEPSLLVEAFADRFELTGPGSVDITLRITNTGNVELGDISVAVPVHGIDVPVGDLGPGEHKLVRFAVAVDRTTDGVATATGVDPLGGTVSATRVWRIVVSGSPATTTTTSPPTTSPPTTSPPPPSTLPATTTTAATAPPTAPMTTAPPTAPTTVPGTTAATVETAPPTTPPDTADPDTTAPPPIRPAPTASTSPTTSDDEAAGTAGPSGSGGDDDGDGLGSTAATLVLGALVGAALVGVGWSSVRAAVRHRR
jgi:hypothetical protein